MYLRTHIFVTCFVILAKAPEETWREVFWRVVRRIINRLLAPQLQTTFNRTGINGKTSFVDVFEPLVKGKVTIYTKKLISIGLVCKFYPKH